MTTEQGKPEAAAPSDGYDEFASAFASLTENGEPPAPDAGEAKSKPAEAASPSSASAAPKAGAEGSSGAPLPATPAPAAPSDAAASAGTPSTKEGEEPAAEPAAEPAKPEAAGAEPAKPEAVDTTDWKAKYEELAAQRAPAPTPEPAAKKEEAPEPPPIYNDDETAFLKDYDKEWPDVIKGEALKRRGEYRILTQHIFNEFQRVYGPVLQRAVETSESFEDDTMLRAIRDVHDDYNDAMYEGVVQWAGSLKGFERLVAEGVIKEGSPQDVVDLISKYKEAKGIKPAAAVAAAAAPATPPAKASVTELPAAAKKAAKALGVVDSKRGNAAPTANDPNDFDAAWNEAVAAK